MSNGYVFVMGPCIACKRPFSFNPHHVPSIRITPESPREPVCESCFDTLNEARKAKGLEPWTRQPDAYEAIPEEQL